MQLLLDNRTHILSTSTIIISHPITVDTFDNFLDACVSPSSSGYAPFNSTTIVVDPLDKFNGNSGYIRPSSICKTHVNAFLLQMVGDYCTSIPYSFRSALLHIFISALILSSPYFTNLCSGFHMEITMGLSFYFNFYSSFTITL